MTTLRIIIVSAVFAFIPVSSATPINDSLHQQIEKDVRAFLLAKLAEYSDSDQTHLSIEINQIDDRIDIPACDSGFTYSVNEQSLNQPYLSVRVDCASSDWYLFTSAQVSKTRSIVVAASMLSPNTVLTSANLITKEVEINSLQHTPFTETSSLIGAKIKRRIRAGSPILPNMLCFVCKGDRITIIAQTSGMQVKTAGIAKQDGVVGDTIQVVNANSKKAVIAEVTNAQTVVVNL